MREKKRNLNWARRKPGTGEGHMFGRTQGSLWSEGFSKGLQLCGHQGGGWTLSFPSRCGCGDSCPHGCDWEWGMPPRRVCNAGTRCLQGGTKEPSEPSPLQMTTSVTVTANTHGHCRLAGHRCPRHHLCCLQRRGHVPRVNTPQAHITDAAMLHPGDRHLSEQLWPWQGATQGRPVPRGT